jgi:hypothetical protein
VIKRGVVVYGRCCPRRAGWNVQRSTFNVQLQKNEQAEVREEAALVSLH